jgi:AcrR family transcriptional regulator
VAGPFQLADARNFILEGVLASFAADRFHGTTMRDIELKAGVSR